MTPREKALEAELRALIPVVEEILPFMIPEDASDTQFLKAAHKRLDQVRAALAMPTEPPDEGLVYRNPAPDATPTYQTTGPSKQFWTHAPKEPDQ